MDTNRRALSCPECGHAMVWQFQKVCRQCGAQLVTLPKILHPFHVRVFRARPSRSTPNTDSAALEKTNA